MGWLGPLTPAASVAARVTGHLLRIPGARAVARSAITRTLSGSRLGPAAEHHTTAGITVTAHAHDSSGSELARIELDGPGIYTFTAQALAWGAGELAAAHPRPAGALGPIAAFGLHELERACTSFGLHRVVDHPARTHACHET